jgi:predicted ArsR family transcriptional regulator
MAASSSVSMKQLAYSSIAAFLAHYRALRDAAGKRDNKRLLSTEERDMLAAMETLIEPLRPEERALLLADDANGEGWRASNEERRRRQRAELKLRRLLLAKGILRG